MIKRTVSSPQQETGGDHTAYRLSSYRDLNPPKSKNSDLPKVSPTRSPPPMAAAAASRAIFCELGTQKSPKPSKQLEIPAIARLPAAEGGGKIVLQPRLCTLRSYGPDSPAAGGRAVVQRRPVRDRDDDVASSFFASLAYYIESHSKSHDFEIVSGRLAMVKD